MENSFLENIEAFILKRIAAAQQEHNSPRNGLISCAAATAQTYGECPGACGPIGALGALPT